MAASAVAMPTLALAAAGSANTDAVVRYTPRVAVGVMHILPTVDGDVYRTEILYAHSPAEIRRWFHHRADREAKIAKAIAALEAERTRLCCG